MRKPSPLPTLDLALGSKEFLRLPMDVFSDGTVPADPSSLPVYFAFLVSGLDPVEADWVPGSWQSLEGVPNARINVAPTTLGLAKGSYKVWVRIVGASEEPQGIVATLKVT